MEGNYRVSVDLTSCPDLTAMTERQSVQQVVGWINQPTREGAQKVADVFVNEDHRRWHEKERHTPMCEPIVKIQRVI